MLGGSETLFGAPVTNAVSIAVSLTAALAAYRWRHRLTKSTRAMATASLGYGLGLIGLWVAGRLLIDPSRLGSLSSATAALGNVAFLGIAAGVLAYQLAIPLWFLSESAFVSAFLGVLTGTAFALRTALSVSHESGGLIVHLMVVFPFVVGGTAIFGILERLARDRIAGVAETL